jgi:hypothetical protein
LVFVHGLLLAKQGIDLVHDTVVRHPELILRGWLLELGQQDRHLILHGLQ